MSVVRKLFRAISLVNGIWMINMSQPSQHPLARRRFLHAGSLLSVGLGLSRVMRLRDLSASELPARRDDTAVILVWLTGGLSHMDTYDLKPEAPLEYRGDFAPIRTNVPGIEVGELLPLQAKIADKFSLIRSVSHGYSDHDGAHKRILTGRSPKSAVGFVNDAPSVGCIVNKVREPLRPDMLAFTSGQRPDTNADSYSQGAGYLGKSYEPFLVGDPSLEKWSIPNLTVIPELAPRMTDRRALLAGFDRVRSNIDVMEVMTSGDHFQQKALSLLTSDSVRKAFDISQEDPALRDRYGRNAYGQQALLARRLVEAGTSFANVVMEHPGIPGPRDSIYNWDCHAVNCHVFNDARWRFPPFDQAVSALIEDILHADSTGRCSWSSRESLGTPRALVTRRGPALASCSPAVITGPARCRSLFPEVVCEWDRSSARQINLVRPQKIGHCRPTTCGLRFIDIWESTLSTHSSTTLAGRCRF